ncbi:Rieske domain-containing protein isoform X1 [Gadus macrocephalus]|uniref:Rieske domain-containing protein isoform X1 n=1 Tax=Gadus macrocephalus TaxID=80720 RepID=UPI0028CB3D2F|nr:Rieske domain-containing protein isoform X1 [Gadus macrocephalus]
MEGKKDARGEAHFVGMREELIEAKRSVRTLEGRDVLVIYHLETFYAIDSYCYHEAGALQTGDIELEMQSTHTIQLQHPQELGGKLCIICPNHKYKITLAEGEGLYKYTDPKEKSPVAMWLSKGPKQRVHSITEANGEVYVKLSEDPQWRESDFYQGERGKVQRANVEEAKAAKAAKALQEKKS